MFHSKSKITLRIWPHWFVDWRTQKARHKYRRMIECRKVLL